MIQPEFQLSYTATAATTTIASGGNVNLHTIVLPKASAGALTIEDVASSPNVYFYLPTGAGPGTFTYDTVLPNGLKMIQASAADYVTVSWKQG